MGITKGSTRALNRFDEGGLKALEGIEGEEGALTVHNAIRIHETAAAYLPPILCSGW